MADLYGNIDDFLEHKINILVILRFYSLQIPNMLVQVLPAALLFSTLWTLLSLNRRCELVAFQAGGMAPIWLFTPFFAFALIWVVILSFDLNWPAAKAEVTRERLLLQVKGQNAKSNVFRNLPYIDRVNRRVWFFESLDTNQNKAKDVTITQMDAYGHDMVIYGAHEAKWTGEFWRLSGVKKIVYGVDGSVQDQKTYEELDLPDITTPPKQLSLIVSQPEQLTVSQLSEYIRTSTSSPENLAKYRTEWWYRVIYPFSLVVLMLFALLQGTRTDRRNALGGVMLAILVLLCFIAFNQIFLAFGSHNRLPPFIAVIATEMIFGAIGLHLLALNNGWWWQLLEVGKRWREQWSEGHSTEHEDT
jgi:lipopolysaccharide export system permease protein